KCWCSLWSFCIKMTAHWRQRQKWLNRSTAQCTSHNSSANIITESMSVVDRATIICTQCYHRFSHVPQYSHGDPRNIALIGHWNGWQPFSTFIKHYCGSVELEIANMLKSDRAKTDEVYVSEFVPNYMLPNKASWSFDPFWIHYLLK
uniref:Uncharacterized protein n=1 Tax=Amphimedon queenslandica TaxID=400682 RepID=A0A1X7SW07_AMPQE